MTPQPPPPSRPSSLRWWMVFMAFLGTAINYIDRANLGVALGHVEKDLTLDPSQSGLLLGAFFWTYALFQLPSGWLVDRVGARVTYAVAVIWWSCFTGATALVGSFTALFVVRLLLGMGEAPAYPANAKVVSEWFPKRERAFATSIFDSGSRVGTALSVPLVAAIIGAWGWRASFLLTGALGIAWAVAWVAVYRSPSRPVEPVVEAPPAVKIHWRDLFRYRTVWGMMGGFFCLNFVIYFFITWFPSYLVKARGFSLPKLGAFGALPALFAIPCGYAGGLFSDFLVRRGVDLTRARKIPIVAGMLTSSVIALAVVVPDAWLALALLCVSYGSLTFAAASVWSLPGDIAPTRGHVASIGGIQNFASNLAGVLTTSFIGVTLKATGSFVVPLVVAGVFSVLGALSYLFVVGRIEPLGSPP